LKDQGVESIEETYYEKEPLDGEKGFKITFHDSRIKEVDEDNGGENPE
jgi:hypothetical protein